MNNVSLQIIRKSDKGAALISDNNGISFWVMPRMVRADGSFTPSVYEKYNDLKERKAKTDEFLARFDGYLKFWDSPNKPGNFRIYYGREGKFIAGTCTKGYPSGYYERHRYCKGEHFYKVFVHDTGGLPVSDVLDAIERFENHIVECYEARIVLGFNLKVLIKGDDGKYTAWQ